MQESQMVKSRSLPPNFPYGQWLHRYRNRRQLRNHRMHKSHSFKPLLTIGLCAMLMACARVDTKGQPQEGTILETHLTLNSPPKGSVELLNGSYQSVMLHTPCPFRVFSPVNPKWPALADEEAITSEGMRLVVYVMNLKGVPRPSTATDRSIIEDLIAKGFLVVTVDFAGEKLKDHLEFQKDITGLFAVFGGQWHTEQPYFTKNRKSLLQFPGTNEGMSFTSFDYSRNGSIETIPVNRAGIYVIPSGYTVEPHLVFNANLQGKDARGPNRTRLFLDVVYPKASPNNQAVPLLYEGSSTSSGEFVVNANTPILYSWLFNGYAFASMCFLSMESDPDTLAQVEGIRYLQSRKERYSLSGKVATAGISKSCARCFSESNMKSDSMHGKDLSRVDVCMPAVGNYPDTVLENLDKNSPALVLSWCHLNGGGKSNGDEHRAIQAAYANAGLSDKCLYFSSPKAGHEYDVYHLNQIIEFFDRFCK